MIRSPAGFDGGDRIKRYLDYYQPSYGVMMLSAGQFSPASLFSAGEQGAWYDPSDFSTMFQDSAGTTPVTAVEQPVGLLLDKSKGLALGSELVTNGDFSVDANWTKETGWSISGGKAVFTSGGTAFANIYQSFTTVVGRSYTLRYDLGVVSAGNTSVKVYTGAGIGGAVIGAANFITAPTTQAQVIFVATATTTTVGLQANQSLQNLQFDNISVRELAGNHASQATSTSRPVLSARVNQLTFSEQFSNAVWVKDASGTGTAPTVSSGFVDPDGGSTAWRIQLNRGAGTSGTDFSRMYIVVPANNPGTGKIYLKSNTASSYSTHVGFGGAAVTVTVTPTWQLFTVPQTGQADFDIVLRGSIGADATADILMWHPDVRVTNDGVGIPAYQRINAATDYDTSGFPLYLRFDGTDDSLATASVDFSATNKMSVFAGVRKLSDAADGMVYQMGDASALQSGTFELTAPGSSTVTKFQFLSRGTVNAIPFTTSTTYNAPYTGVIAGLGDISGDAATLRINGAQIAQILTDQGTGNYGNYPLYIGRRAGTSFPYNGRLYSLIIRGAQSTTAQITSTETWVNGKTKAY